MRFQQFLYIVMVGLALSACATKANVGINAMTPVAFQSADATSERVFLATMRAPSPDKNLLFGGERADHLHFADFNVSVPNNRIAGSIEFPTAKPDLKKQFAVTSATLTDDESILASRLHAALATLPPEQRNIFIFIHGYNVSFAEGLFDQAQLRHDYEIPGVSLHYSWPSAAKTALYLYDRDSAEYARDGLVKTLKIAAAAHPKSIVLLGHSMGTFVTMEALRTLSLQGDTATVGLISPLILAAPDIDQDVFREQLASLTTRPKAIMVLVSEEDKALRISGGLRGGKPRVGAGANKDELVASGLIVLDLATVRAKGDGLSHSTYANSPALIALVRSGKLNIANLAGGKRAKGNNILAQSLGFGGDLLSSIVYLPAKLVGAR
jgi:esterase/lipase superfamily enzyme